VTQANVLFAISKAMLVHRISPTFVQYINYLQLNMS